LRWLLDISTMGDVIPQMNLLQIAIILKKGKGGKKALTACETFFNLTLINFTNKLIKDPNCIIFWGDMASSSLNAKR